MNAKEGAKASHDLLLQLCTEKLRFAKYYAELNLEK